MEKCFAEAKRMLFWRALNRCCRVKESPRHVTRPPGAGTIFFCVNPIINWIVSRHSAQLYAGYYGTIEK